MLFGAALAAFLSVQPDSALERLQLFMSSSPAFELKGSASVKTVGPSGQTRVNDGSPMTVSLRWQKSTDQVFVAGGWFEMRQTEEALVVYNNKAKTYQEYKGFRFPMAPNGKDYFEQYAAYPWFLTDFSETLKALSSPDWTTSRNSSGWVMTGRWRSELSGEDVVMTLNDRGLPTKVVRTIKGDEMTVVIEHDIASLTGIPAFATPSLQAAAGYLPEGLTKFYMPTPGDVMKSHPIYGVDGSTTDLKSLMGKNGVALLFTAPDCEVSARSAADLAALKGDLERAGYSVQEVSLGAAKPGKSFSGARLFHDRDGNLERKWAISSTPYLICVDKASVVVGAWEGWWPGCKAAALKSLTEKDPD
jgi:hypothetical protein